MLKTWLHKTSHDRAGAQNPRRLRGNSDGTYLRIVLLRACMPATTHSITAPFLCHLAPKKEAMVFWPFLDAVLAFFAAEVFAAVLAI